MQRELRTPVRVPLATSGRYLAILSTMSHDNVPGRLRIPLAVCTNMFSTEA